MLKLKTGILLLSLAASTALFSADSTKIKDKIQNIDFIKKVGFMVKDVKEVGDLYAINAAHPRAGKVALFVSKDLNTVVIGQGFASNGEPIEFPISMEQFKSEAAYTIGDGKKEYYLFTDPECPFCQKFEQMSNNLQNDLKIYVFFFPLNEHHNAKAMSKYILSQKTSESKAKAMHDIATGKTDYKSMKLSDAEDKKYSDVISKHLKIGQEIGVTGTPSVFDSKGKPVQWPALLKQQ